MVKKILVVALFALLSNGIYSQSRKDQIESLTHLSDSLEQLVYAKNAEIEKLKTLGQDKDHLITQRELEIDRLKSELHILDSQMAKTNQRMDSTLKVISTFKDNTSPFSSKKQIVTRLIGKHNLTHISGFMGANTLFETYRNNAGNWASEHSVLEMGTREVYENELTRADNALLDGLSLEVDSNLTIRFISGSKVVFSSKFIETGVDYKIEKQDGVELNEDLANLSSASSFVDDYLIIYVRNGVDWSQIIKGNFDMITEDCIILKYNLFNAQFELTLFYTECCGNNTLYFNH